MAVSLLPQYTGTLSLCGGAWVSIMPRHECQDVENARQRRSRFARTLNVPQRVRLGPSLAAALLDSHFEHPAEASTVTVPVGDLLGY